MRIDATLGVGVSTDDTLEGRVPDLPKMVSAFIQSTGEYPQIGDVMHYGTAGIMCKVTHRSYNLRDLAKGYHGDLTIHFTAFSYGDEHK